MGNINILEIVAKLAVQFLPFLFALCFHEFAHGWMAKRKGDNTAELMGRLTLNPFAHADLLGTFILPIAGILGLGGFAFFGWAKPVPVNSRNLKRPREDMFWIALAGPASNFILAIISIAVYILIGAFVHSQAWAESSQAMCASFVTMNMFLCVFNLIPLHPLDGGKIIARFLPREWNYFLEQHESQMGIVLIILMLVGAFRYLAIPVVWMIDHLFQVISLVLMPIL
jgi:Zn-dependent protease